jgi:hypothetical protein
MAASLCAQEATAPSHTGFPQDWSQQHIVFSRDGLAQHPDLIYREPRVLHQAMQRWQVPNFGAFEGSERTAATADNSGLHPDWNVHPLGGRLFTNAYPTKFSFNPGAPPDCTNDYVVFGLNTPDTTGAQANLIAFNNLYVDPAGDGLCPVRTTGVGFTAPTVLFAYDITTVTGGKIATSPILSEDGKKIAFVEGIPADAGLGITAESIFHVLTWTAGQGAIGAAAPPPAGPLWVSLPLPSAKNDTTSSPWIDYYTDTAYVGSAAGYVYEITGVFRGTPTLVTPPWTNPVINNNALTSPVLDSNLGMLMFGAGNGDLYGINTTTGTVAHLVVGQGTNHAILAAPIVDVTNGVTFVVDSDCGTSCAPGVPSGAVLVEADTKTVTRLSEASIGIGGAGVALYQPALDNNYYNNPSTGLIHLCGTGTGTDTSPWQYAFGFSGRTMSSTPATGFPMQLSTSANDLCTGWTEFFNPYAGASDTITATSVASNVLTVTVNNSNLTVGEEVYIQGTAENFLNGQGVKVVSLIGSGPTYTGFTASFTASNYTNPSDTGTVTAGTDFFFFGLDGDCTLLGSSGSTTGCVVALSSDPTIPTASVTIDGGPTGVIVDNYSTAAQASSIYFTAKSISTAYKYTQNGLK